MARRPRPSPNSPVEAWMERPSTNDFGLVLCSQTIKPGSYHSLFWSRDRSLRITMAMV